MPDIIKALFHQGIFDPEIIASKLDFFFKNGEEVIAYVEDLNKPYSYSKVVAFFKSGLLKK
ncbi:MAG: hypothetical protein EU529_17175 [Promethearchaeota archaeon]|nr:MAG: hypothetical protein EU529_17175 [Candidatus Lokiarchaeota archaeon]